MSEPQRRTPTVVWWRSRVTMSQMQRSHRIGWVDVTGRPHGQLNIVNQHLRLDPRTIETALAHHLVPHPYPQQPAIHAAGLVDPEQLSSEAQLILDGHTITDADLATAYGLDIVAGVSARLHGAGPRAVIAIEKHLGEPVRAATMTAIHHAVADFAAADPNELTATGWHSLGEGRWQLLLHQH
ncbi:MAG TPA: hypothetical protein VFP34_13155 [Microlunatus sp.]|nr:hypothetical protein [Microlunatus sp.]